MKTFPGDKFGKLTILNKHRMLMSGERLWLCKCECGTEKFIQQNNLRSGNTKSCGCYQRKQTSLANKTHGLKKHPIYTSWGHMKTRCYNLKSPKYSRYGGRGIRVCKRWHKFDNFYLDMVEKWRPGLQIDRIDNNKGYYPSNCRWATTVQQQNNRGNNHRIKFKGKTMTLAQWSKKLNIPKSTLFNRLNVGLSVDKAFSSGQTTFDGG